MARPLERHLLVGPQADPPWHRQVNAFEVEVVAGIAQPLHEGVGARVENGAPGAVCLLDATVQRCLGADQLAGVGFKQRCIALFGEFARQGLSCRIGEQTQRMFGAGRLQGLAQRLIGAGVGAVALLARADLGHRAIEHVLCRLQPSRHVVHARADFVGHIQLAKQAPVVASAWVLPVVVQQIEFSTRQRKAGTFQHPGLRGDVVEVVRLGCGGRDLVRFQGKGRGLGLAQDITRPLGQQGVGTGI